ncbi:MAG TPA: glycosyltransferase, partial [Acidimicrobiales bacterium]|nr:glycosyltransferase [Acidimicrobiales bacterium]
MDREGAWLPAGPAAISPAPTATRAAPATRAARTAPPAPLPREQPDTLPPAVSNGQAHVVFCSRRDAGHPEGGGAEQYVHEIARSLASRGNRVTVLCGRAEGLPGDEVRDGVAYR